MDAINNLKEPGGSNKTTIAEYIEVGFLAMYFDDVEKKEIGYASKPVSHIL